MIKRMLIRDLLCYSKLLGILLLLNHEFICLVCSFIDQECKAILHVCLQGSWIGTLFISLTVSGFCDGENCFVL